MYSLGQDSSAEKLQKMMSAVDKDGDKKIDWEEFEAKLGNKVGAESANALQYARKCHSVEYLPLRRRASNEYASRWQGGVQNLRQGWERPDLSAGAAARHDEFGGDAHQRGGG